MRRRRLFIIIAILNLSTTLTGCINSLPFINEDTVEETEAPTQIEVVMESGQFEIGDTISIDQVLTVDPNKELQTSAFYLEDGTTVTEYECSTTGDMAVTVIAQYVDGTAFQGVAYFTVAGASITSILPNETIDFLSNGGTIKTAEYNGVPITVVGPSELESENVNSLVEGLYTYKGSKFLTVVAPATEADYNDPIKPVVDVLTSIAEASVISLLAETEDYNLTLESEVGSTYKFKMSEISTETNKVEFGVGVDDWKAVVSNDGEVKINIMCDTEGEYMDRSIYDIFYSDVSSTITATETMVDESIFGYSSYKSVLLDTGMYAYLKSTNGILLLNISSSEASPEEFFSKMINCVFMKDYSTELSVFTLTADEEVVEDSFIDDTEITLEIEEVVETEEVVEEDTSEVEKPKPETYAEQNPRLFSFEYGSEFIYSMWIPINRASEDFVGAWAYNPGSNSGSGNSFNAGTGSSDLGGNEDINTQTPTDNSGQGGETTVSLSTSFGDFIIGETNSTSVTAKKESSTEVLLTIYDKEYYVQTTTTATVSTVQTNCLFDTAQFDNGEFLVSKGDAYTVGIGTITPYTIAYKKGGEAKIVPYMCTLRTSSGLFIIRSKEILESGNMIEEIASNMIKEG